MASNRISVSKNSSNLLPVFTGDLYDKFFEHERANRKSVVEYVEIPKSDLGLFEKYNDYFAAQECLPPLTLDAFNYKVFKEILFISRSMPTIVDVIMWADKIPPQAIVTCDLIFERINVFSKYEARCILYWLYIAGFTAYIPCIGYVMLHKCVFGFALSYRGPCLPEKIVKRNKHPKAPFFLEIEPKGQSDE